MTNSKETEHIVDGILFNRGYYEPLMFLQQQGSLDYHHYHVWRRGGEDCLDLLLSGDRGEILKSLVDAAKYAQKLGLEAIEHNYTGWKDAAETQLCLSNDKQLQSYLHTHYQLPQKRRQMDIFMDSPATRVSNTLVKSIYAHNLAEASRQLLQLQEIEPEHSQLEDYSLLLNTLALEDEPVANIDDELEWLEQQVVPRAKEILKREARDFLIPQWWRLSLALQDFAFNQDTPKLHCSYMNAHAYDWNGVRDSVEWEKNWYKQPVLLMRHARACYMLNDEIAFNISIFRVFWNFSYEVDAIFETDTYRQLKQEWLNFQDDQKGFADSAFPAWYLMRHSGLINRLPREVEKEVEEGYMEYQLVYALLKSDQDKNEEENMQLRKQLQKANPDLLKCYFQTAAIRNSSEAGFNAVIYP